MKVKVNQKKKKEVKIKVSLEHKKMECDAILHMKTLRLREVM